MATVVGTAENNPFWFSGSANDVDSVLQNLWQVRKGLHVNSTRVLYGRTSSIQAIPPSRKFLRHGQVFQVAKLCQGAERRRLS